MLSVALPQYRIWVDRPTDPDESFEVTQWCSGDSGGFLSVSATPVDESGWVRYQGQLVLDVPFYNAQFDPWETDRWRIGSRVKILVANALGVLSELPWSRLYIVAEPLPPYPGNPSLTIELGCLATLRDGDKNTTETRQAQISRDAVASGLWSKLGNPLTLQSGLPGLPMAKYELALNGGIVEAMGNVASGIGCYFWQDKTTVRPREILLEPPVRLFLHTVGTDDADDFEPLQSPLRPSGEVEVIGQGGATVTETDNNDPKYRGSITTVEKLDKGAIIEGESGVITSAERTESWNWSNGTTFTQTVSESRVRAMVIPMDLYEAYGVIGAAPFDRLADAFYSQQVDRYEAGSEGRKLSSRIEINKPRGQVLADYYKKTLDPNQVTPNFGTPVLAEVQETTWSYQGDDPDDPGRDTGGQVRRVKTIVWKTRGEVAADASNWASSSASPTVLVPFSIREESWTRRARIGEDDWSYTIKEWQAGRVRKGNISAFTRLVLVRHEVKHSRAGDIRPPAAERRPAEEGSPFSASAITTTPKGRVRFTQGDTRKRQIPLYWVESDAEAERIAELHGKIDHYRHRGFRITTRLRDEWFNWLPLSRIDLAYNGKVYIGLTDIVTMTLAADQAIVVADCMRWATAAGPYPG